MDIPKINASPVFTLNDNDEIVSRRKKSKKEDESVIVSKKRHVESLCALLEEIPAPQSSDLLELREKIEKNDYQIDYEKLANSLMTLERLWW